MWLDRKYIGMLSGQLERFRQTDDHTFNCRCPFCGDSKTNEHKARGYFFQGKDQRFNYYCHNCGYSGTFDFVLKQINQQLHEDYIREKLAEKYSPRQKTDVEIFADKMKRPTFIKKSALSDLPKISQLPWDHVAKQYVVRRKIPNFYHSRLFYTYKFMRMANSIVPDKFSDKALKHDGPRLIIPLINEDNRIVGFQGRALDNDPVRYITIAIERDEPMIFNSDVVDRTIDHFIFEGPIDAMFVDNSIAMTGQSIEFDLCNEHSVFVFDNEPRNPHTIKHIEKVIDRGYRVFLWPETVKEKDINDFVIAHPGVDVNQLIKTNISEGLEARIILTGWKKV